jgi:hypothetical protein
MTSSAIPEARHAVDELASLAVPQESALATGDRDERLPGGLGEWVQKPSWHDPNGSCWGAAVAVGIWKLRFIVR